MENAEQQALIAVAGRQDKAAIEAAQTEARTILRASAKAAREVLTEENRRISASKHSDLQTTQSGI